MSSKDYVELDKKYQEVVAVKKSTHERLYEAMRIQVELRNELDAMIKER